ncbi:MAG: DUF2264 domain-containing protein [Bacteroidales bacterium]|nr:DUF2264 domain-containing protein [Bacteroidales bacterium]
MKASFSTVGLLLVSALSLAQTPSENDIKKLLTDVNTTWQKSHSFETRPFWDDAVYHCANLEAYKVTGNNDFLDYTTKWAVYNNWMGATGNDPKEWKMTYGEKPEYALFGDWQICFQAYADLYQLTPDNKMIARARQVMEYEMATPRHDYWWWADGLFMVMPVMTKMHNITGNDLYLAKLAEYYDFADSLMRDPETGFFFRDAKYVFPKHKTNSGKKDFWARGNGWVLAAYARIIPDLPDDYKHKQVFINHFKALAQAVKNSQQKEGYWTRSILDPEQAPGPETSGTAFFTYGLLWGVNSGVISESEYMPTITKAWNYLTKTALQKDKTIGYVQPIGERAIPGQTISAKSVANFGTAAFLLAATEYARYAQLREANTTNAKNAKKSDRQQWVDFARQLADPVLSAMAEGKLNERMEIEVSPTWDGRDKRVTYMEAFGRLMAGLAPWLTLPDDNTAEGRIRKDLREKALKAYANAVDPNSGDYLLWRKEGQPLVDAAYLAQSFLRGWDALWTPLSDETKKRYIEEFTQLRRIDPPYTNWLLFSATIETVLYKAGANYDMYRINSAIRKVEEWYVGDGWYADGTAFAFDYYSSYVFHPMYLDVLDGLKSVTKGSRLDYQKYFNRELQRCQKFAIVLERFISPEGTFPVFGRSIPYRMAAMQPLAVMAHMQSLPAGLTNGSVRSALTAVMHRMFDGKENFNSKGFLTIGFCGRQPNIADWYTNNGSLYMTSLFLMPLGLPANHPFWTDAPLPWTQQRAWGSQDFPKDHRWKDNITTWDKF